MFIEGTKVGLRYYSPMEGNSVIFTNSINGDDPNFLPNQWNNVTVPSLTDDPANGIPDDCLGVFLSGIAIVTGGTDSTDPIADLEIRFRRWLSGNNPYYPMFSVQAMSEPGVPLNDGTGRIIVEGARHPFMVLVPVDVRRFQVYWTRSTTTPANPVHPCYGFNAYVCGYVRP